MQIRTTFLLALVTLVTAYTQDFPQTSQTSQPLHGYLKDRGTGMPTSMFGTYIRKGELLVYPFFEYYSDHNIDYQPADLGYTLEKDFEGKYTASEGIFFIGYGITDWLAVEFEAAVIKATLETSVSDNSAAPDKITESGTGDVEGQIRARWLKETVHRPEFFSYFEAVSPQQKNKPLIGTLDWELKFGSGLIRGFSWGTMTLRMAVDYSKADSKLDLGEYAVEYVKRLSPTWRMYVGVEGSGSDFGLITEAQWFFTENIFLKLNNSIGITPKATDWAPEIGIMFSFPDDNGNEE